MSLFLFLPNGAISTVEWDSKKKKNSHSEMLGIVPAGGSRLAL